MARTHGTPSRMILLRPDASEFLALGPEDAHHLRRVIQQASVATLILGGQTVTVVHDLHTRAGRRTPAVHLERGLFDAVQVPLDVLANDMVPKLTACAALESDHPPTLPLRYGFALRLRTGIAGIEVLTEELTVAATVNGRTLPALQQAPQREGSVLLGGGSRLCSWPEQGRYRFTPDEGLNLELDREGYATLLGYLPPLLADLTN